MEVKLRLGGIVFLFCGEAALKTEPELVPFMDQKEADADITIRISRSWETVRLPSPGTKRAGEDALLEYYVEGNTGYCLAKGGWKGFLACTCYPPDFKNMLCTLNDAPFLYPISRLGSILRLLPMRMLFLYHQVLFLHASQISVGGKGILFSAPSGGGKSTQARLWQKYREAELVCNDRTLVRKGEEGWLTYGYPIDGSEPVRNSRSCFLGCIVLLEQGNENQLCRLRAGAAAGRLMRQIVMDTWSMKSRIEAMELILKLLAEIPVYLLRCTPDERAVEVLETKLMEDGVIPGGKGF